MALRIVTPPSGGLISRDEAKLQLRVDYADEDDLIDGLILTATSLVQASVQRLYLAQVVDWIREDWCHEMVLPVAPGGDSTNCSITSVKYFDLAGVQQTLDPTYYWDRPVSSTRAVVRRWNTIWPFVGDGAERVVIRFAITGGAEDVSPLAKHAVRMTVTHLFENRDASALPDGCEQLLTSERWNS